MNVDRIFHVPVELAASTFRIPAEQRLEGNRTYDRFVTGVHWGEASVLLFAGGLAAGAAGVEAGGATALLSIGLAYASLLRVIAHSGNLKRQSQ